MHLFAAIDPQSADQALTGWDAIRAADGVAISVTGTLIVFVALTAISLFIGVLPKVLAALGPWLPEIESHHDKPSSAVAPIGNDKAPLAGAIAVAVHRSRGG